MFNYVMTYTNNRNETFVFGKETGLYLDASNLFDWEWEPNIVNGHVVALERSPREIPVGFEFIQSVKKAGIINAFDDIIDYDARLGKPGKLYLNGYWVECCFIKSRASDYEYKPGLMRRDMTLLVYSPSWRQVDKARFENYLGTASEGQGKGFPTDYPLDYKSKDYDRRYFINDSPFPADFVIRIFGPCTHPYIVIGDNTYAIDVVLGSNEYVEIDSTDHTKIIKRGAYGEETNVFEHAQFGAPGSGAYIFEPFKPGVNDVSLPGIYAVDVEIIKWRSIPKWYENDTPDAQ